MKRFKQFISILLLFSMVAGIMPSGLCNAFETTAYAQSLLDFMAVAAGYDFSLGLKKDGTVVACGISTYGQCAVPDDLNGVTAISAGYAHSLALKEDGTVVAWGDDSNYQCSVPKDLANVQAISAGTYHSLALKEDGTVIAWGDNYDDQLNIPEGLTDVIAISAGAYHSLALKEDGTVVAWGSNFHNQTEVPEGLTDVIAISAGAYHSLALKKDGTVVAWGIDSDQCYVPEELTDVIAIDSGDSHCLALKKDGTVIAWGLNYDFCCDVPTYLTDAKLISAGYTHNIAVRENGEIVTWGSDTYGECSFSETIGIRDISAGPYSALFLKEDGTVFSKGRDTLHPRKMAAMEAKVATKATESPFTREDLKNITAIATGIYHYLALSEDGTVTAWGDNSYNQCEVPPSLPKVVAIAAGSAHSVALTEDGTVVAWGDNSYQQCDVPEGLDKVKAIYATEHHTAAIKEDGTVVVWGEYASQMNKILEGVNKVKELAIGQYHMLALKEDGTVSSWIFKEFTDPDEYFYNYAKTVVPEGLSDVKTIAAGSDYSIAVKSDGTVVLWGYYPSPEVSHSHNANNLKNIKKISANRDHIVALTESGTVIEYLYGDICVYYYPPLPSEPETKISNISVTDNLISIQFSGSTLMDVSEDDFTIIRVTSEEDRDSVSEPVYGSIFSFDISTNTVVLQVPDIIPSGSYKRTRYYVSYKSIAESSTDEVITPPAVLPTPTYEITYTPTPIYTSTSTPIPTSLLTPEPTTILTPAPTTTLTPVPTTILTPAPTTILTPAPTTILTPAPTTILTPVPTTTLTPAPTTTLTPAPTTILTPVPTITLTPAPTTTLTPAHTPLLTSAPTPLPNPTPAPARTSDRSTSRTPYVTSPVEEKPGPVATPQGTPAIGATDYEESISDLKNNVTEIVEMYKGAPKPDTDINDGDINELIIKEAEKAIEKISSIKKESESGSIEVNKELVSAQGELALKAAKDIKDYFGTISFEPNRTIDKRINIDVDTSSTKLTIHLIKDLEYLADNEVDIRISTAFGAIIIYHENLKDMLSKDLLIIMEEEKTDPSNPKMKSCLSLSFVHMDGTRIENLNCKIGLELPYGDGNPDYCAIYHEKNNVSYARKPEQVNLLQTNGIYAFNKQNQRTILNFPYRNEKSEYGAVSAKPNDKVYNLGGHENTDTKMLRVSTASYGRYYVIEDKKTYNDLAGEDPAAKEAIEVLSSKGIIHGKNNGSFDPGGELKRSEFVCLIVNVLNIIDEDATTDFIDVPLTAWYYNPVAIAATEKLVSGYPGNRFLGNNPINNQEIIKICASTLQKEKGYNLPKDESNLLIFKDNKGIQDWARKYVSLGVREGLVVKRADGCFNAGVPCTRRDAALILYRLYKKLN